MLYQCSQCDTSLGYISNKNGGCKIPQCGDGYLNTNLGEECDDGNNSELDGCSSTCKIEEGWSCTTNELKVSVCRTICGDGKIIS
jgi:large repetitive protein